MKHLHASLSLSPDQVKTLESRKIFTRQGQFSLICRTNLRYFFLLFWPIFKGIQKAGLFSGIFLFLLGGQGLPVLLSIDPNVYLAG